MDCRRPGRIVRDSFSMRTTRDSTVDMPALILPFHATRSETKMDIRKLAPEVSVSAQIAAGDVAAIQAAVFRSIICNRPDSETAKLAGHDLKGLLRRLVNGGKTLIEVADGEHQIVIIGGGSAGIAAASSLLARDGTLDIAIIDPADVHYYQPGWTMVGAGIFQPATTARTMA